MRRFVWLTLCLLALPCHAAAAEEAKAAGATVAGMIVFGPVGVVTGAFVHGKELTVPAGSTLFVQAKEDVELYGLVNQ